MLLRFNGEPPDFYTVRNGLAEEGIAFQIVSAQNRMIDHSWRCEFVIDVEDRRAVEAALRFADLLGG